MTMKRAQYATLWHVQYSPNNYVICTCMCTVEFLVSQASAHTLVSSHIYQRACVAASMQMCAIHILGKCLCGLSYTVQREIFAGANFHGIACQPFRRNIRGFNFRVERARAAPQYHVCVHYAYSNFALCLFKFSWFFFSRWPTYPRKTRNFAPCENFLLYGKCPLAVTRDSMVVTALYCEFKKHGCYVEFLFSIA